MPESETTDKPTTWAELPPEGMSVGVDLGGTNIQFGVVDANGRVHARGKEKTDVEGGVEAIVDSIVQGIDEVCAKAGIKSSALAAIGVGAPGPVEPAKGIVLEAGNLRWGRVRLAELIEKRLGVDVFIDNDVNAAVFGESRLGAAKGATDILGVWVGTGVGGGLILGGRIYYGKHFSAGEIGHMVLMPGNAPGTRSIEHNCSRTTIAARITYLVKAGRKSSLEGAVDAKSGRIKSKVLREAYEQGDELALEVINDSADRLGMGIASVVTLLSLDKVVLGGGLVEALGETYVSRVRARVHEHAFPKRVKGVDVVASTLEDDAGIVGAGLMALHRQGV